MYLNQKSKKKKLDIKVIIMVWINRIPPRDMGWFKKINIVENIQLSINNATKITGNSLLKILILEVKDKGFLFSWSFKR